MSKQIFDLECKPGLILCSDLQGRMGVKSSKALDRILMVAKIKVEETTIKLSPWLAQMSVLLKDCWSLGSRWVSLVGVPLHLWSFKQFWSLCASFGRVDEVKDFMDKRYGASVVYVHCQDPNLSATRP